MTASLRRCVAMAVLFVGAKGDCHMKGMAKTTYATSAESARVGAALLLRALNMTVARDSWPGDVAVCPAGSSGQAEAWPIIMGRVETLKDPATIGSCYVLVEGNASETFAAREGVAAVTPSAWESGAGCSYGTMSGAGRVAYSYVLPAHTAEGCCNACGLDASCAEAYYDRGSEDQTNENFVGECFGLHITSVEGHGTEHGLSVAEVEAQFSEKLAGMASFDAFMDYNVALYTQNVDWYVANLAALGLPWLGALWPYAGGTKEGYSVIFHLPKTQLVVELLSFSAPTKPSPHAVRLEQRMTDARVAQFEALEAGDARLLAASVSRAATNLTSMHEFYVAGLGATQTMGFVHKDVRKKCFVLDGTTADVCFVKRGAAATRGPFSVGDFEAMLHETHAHYLNNTPNCAMDRWMDNHYAIDTDVTHTPFLRWLVDNPHVKYTCADTHRPGASGAGVHYVFDPTGWGIQMDGDETVFMPGCDAAPHARPKGPATECNVAAPAADDCLYWCNAGTC